MSGFFKYLRVQLKRSVRIYPVIICFTVILSLCVALLLSSLLSEDAANEKNIRVKVGLVGDIDDTHLGVGISVVKDVDSSKYYVDFIPLEEEEADKQLEQGEIMGYISVPEDYVEAVTHGENKHLTYIASGSSTGIGPMLVKEVVGIISDILTQSQNGVYGLSDLCKKYGFKYAQRSEAMDELNFVYFDSIFSREESYEIEILGTGNGLGFADYYFCAFSVLLMLLWGIICIPMFAQRDMTLPRLMYSQGRYSICQISGEYIPFLFVVLLNLILFVFGGSLILNGFEGAGFGSVFFGAGGILYMLPCVLIITAMQFLIYELCSGVVSTVLAQMLTALALSYASGLIYPSGTLPTAVQRVADITPTGMAFNYMASVISNNQSIIGYFSMLLCFVILIAASCLVRRYKCRRVQL